MTSRRYRTNRAAPEAPQDPQGITRCPVPGCPWVSAEMAAPDAVRAYITHLDQAHEQPEVAAS